MSHQLPRAGEATQPNIPRHKVPLFSAGGAGSLKYPHQFLQMRNLVCRLALVGYFVWVVIDSIHTHINGAEDVYIYCITDHDGFFGSGLCEIEREVENVFVRLHAVALLRRDEVREVAGNARVLQLQPLGGLKTIGDEVHLVAALAVVQHFFGMWYQQGLRRQQLQVVRAHFVSQRGIGYLIIEQGKPHTLPAQLIALYEFITVALPQLIVMKRVLHIHLFKVGDATVFKVVFLIQLAHGYLRVLVKIPQGMVQVEEEVFVYFGQSDGSCDEWCKGRKWAELIILYFSFYNCLCFAKRLNRFL